MYTNLRILVEFVSSDPKNARDTKEIAVAENLSVRVPACSGHEMYETQIDVSVKTAVHTAGQ